MTKTIGVIGLGSIGMRHAKNLIAMGHIVMGFDLDEYRRVVASSVGIEICGPEKMFDGCEGIVIASPSSTHAQYMEDALCGEHNKVKAILVEKPIDSNLNAAQNAYGNWRYCHNSAPIMVGNNLRFHSCVKKAKEWLAEGKIGKPLWASFCVAQHNTKYTDPVALNWGAHEVDLALYLLGPAMVTAATGGSRIFDMCLFHEYGVPSTIHMDYVTDPERRIFLIAGDEGTMQINIPLRSAYYTPADRYKTHIQLIDDEGSFDQDYKDEMQAFIDLIDGKPVPHAATGQDGLNALEVILEAQREAST